MLASILSLLCYLNIISLAHGAWIEDLHETSNTEILNFISLSNFENVGEDGISLKPRVEEVDDFGNQLLRLEQYYKAIRLFDGDIVYNKIPSLEGTEYSSQSINGHFVREMSDDIASIDYKYLNKKQREFMSDFAKKEKCSQTVEDRISETVIYVDEQTQKGQFGFIVGCMKKSDSSYPTVLLNDRGTVVYEWNQVQNLRANASGPGGNKKIGKIHYNALNARQKGNQCFLETEYVVVHHNHFSNQMLKRNPFKFRCPNQTVMEINHGYCPMNDAFNFANNAVRMFRKLYDVFPFRKQPIILYIHYGKNYTNALSVSDGQRFAFGDGDGNISYPFSSSSKIVGHELGHGVMYNYPKLDYHRFAQSGALHEAFGDMTGVTLKRFITQEPVKDWLYSDDITELKPGDPHSIIRCLDNPPCKKGNIDKCWQWGRGINHTREAHQSSGVFSKVFYLIARQMPRDALDAYDIFFCAVKHKYSKKINFETAAALTMETTENLIATKGKWCTLGRKMPKKFKAQVVVKAFANVGLHCARESGSWTCKCRK